MALNKEQLEVLYEKYIQNQCTTEELQALINELGEDPPAFQADVITGLFDKTWEGLEEPHEAPVIAVASARKWWLRIAAAAAIILLTGAGAYWWLSQAPKPDLATTNKYIKNDIAPGGNRAVLTLADGTSIVLDSAHNGILTQQGNAAVVKQRNGQLAYQTAASYKLQAASQPVYNALATPRGGQYQLVLPDGTKVWLNAASSIRYPTAFAGKERKIEMTGEAYFEVAVNAGMPFIVKANGQEVKVLGTQFNVNAYEDEAMVKTTLLEGAVQVTKDAATTLLKPGQQCSLTKSGTMTVTDDVDPEDAVAWKNGMFSFKSADIRTIMRQIARWYDVDIVYNKDIQGRFNAEIPRNIYASDVLKALELTRKVKFGIDGKKIIVMP